MFPPLLKKAKCVKGQFLKFANANADDVGFIFALRNDLKRTRHLSEISKKIEDQKKWMENYARDSTQVYFVIRDAESDERIGTVRLYAACNRTFSWGSWLLRAGLPPRCAIESALIVYRYAIALGFNQAYFEVRVDNVSVWRFHENFGAQRTGELQGQYLYELAPEALLAGLKKYQRYLPDDVSICF